MSSILSRLKMGRWELPSMPEKEWERALAVGEFLVKQICRTGPDAPKLVNIQAVVRDIVKPIGDGEIFFETHYSKLPPVTPPFPLLWLECVFSEIQMGFLVRREDRADGWDIQIYTFEMFDGRVFGPTVLHRFELPANGRMGDVKAVKTQLWDSNNFREVGDVLLKLRVFTIASALARMNCRNVELRQIPGAKAPRYQGSVTPASIWHEIHISSVPRLRSTGKDATVQTDERLIRCHWIRGHYADYSEGPGLFGNPKLRCVFWIPEHQKGNADLGHVIPEYRLEGGK